MKKGDRKVALEITRLATVRIYWAATDGYLEGAIRAAGHAAKEVLAGNTAEGAVADRLRAAAVRSALGVGWDSKLVLTQLHSYRCRPMGQSSHSELLQV